MSDANARTGPCVQCGSAEADTEYVTRLPCERCGRVHCYRCADTGVYGSRPDFQHFVSGTFNRTPSRLSADCCPFCQTMSWMKKHGG